MADRLKMPLTPSKPWLGTLHALLLLPALVFLALHASHLAADFPNFSPWQDWSKYTDEGWYGDAAIRHFQLGHWYVPGDFNPAAALPVWPFLEALLFHFTGVSLVAVRALTVAVFAGILVASWFLICRWSNPRSDMDLSQGVPTPPVAASAAVLLLTVSPFCFVFTRLAILEPLLILLTLVALLVVSSVKVPSAANDHAEPAMLATIRANLGPVLALGFLLPLMVLTKTTALFLLPAIAWLLFATVGYRLPRFLHIVVSAGLLAVSLWLGYFLLIVRPHFLLDYQYLFSANAYTGITRANCLSVLYKTLVDGKWMGHLFYAAAAVSTLVALLSLRHLRRHPLVPTLLLWAVGYAAFLAYHNNLQPRYYLVIAVPLSLLIPVVLEQLLLPRLRSPHAQRLSPALWAAAIALLALPAARQTLHYVRHPEYTLVRAAEQVHDYIAEDRKKDPGHNPLILSISGSDLSLMTGLPSICDDFGTLELGERVRQYRPGWYLAWNQLDDDKMDAIAPLFHLERVATFPAMDDADRNLMILYRLDPAGSTPPRTRRRQPTPRRLQTRLGQQPSTSQLQH